MSKPATAPDTHWQELDYIYSPSSDVAAEVDYFTSVLGAQLVFAIEAMNTRVAMLELTRGAPRVLLADHLEGEAPILVYRVAKLEAALSDLEKRGWRRGETLELPMGPACSFTTPGGHRIALYELTRANVVEHFAGRRDF